MKMAIKRRVFGHNSQTCVWSYGPCEPPRTSKLWAIAEKRRFRGHSSLNRIGTPKQWAIAHENGQEIRKWRVFGHALKHVSGLTVILNLPRTPKLWAITYESGHKTQKRRVFGHNSQTCLGSYGPCESPWNLKTAGNSLRKRP